MWTNRRAVPPGPTKPEKDLPVFILYMVYICATPPSSHNTHLIAKHLFYFFIFIFICWCIRRHKTSITWRACAQCMHIKIWGTRSVLLATRIAPNTTPSLIRLHILYFINFSFVFSAACIRPKTSRRGMFACIRAVRYLQQDRCMYSICVRVGLATTCEMMVWEYHFYSATIYTYNSLADDDATKQTYSHAHMLIQTNISKIAYTRRGGPTTSRRRAGGFFTYTRFAYNAAQCSILFVYDEDERSEKKHIQMICNVCAAVHLHMLLKVNKWVTFNVAMKIWKMCGARKTLELSKIWNTFLHAIRIGTIINKCECWK